MSDRVNRQWRLATRPAGMVEESDFEPHEAPVPKVGDGDYLLRTLYVSVDPAQRGWMNEDPGYMPPVPLGEVMPAATVSQVVESRHPDYPVGAFVFGYFGWQEYALGSRGLMPSQVFVPEHPLPRYLGVLGGTGLTAYFGLLEVGRAEAGQTVLVSGAAGATGSVAAQIGKITGCRVVGIAGGGQKCAWLTGELGLDAAIDYKSEDVGARLTQTCPDGVDVYFDNVGGAILEAAIAHMAQGGRIACCGMIAGYNAATPQPGPANLFLLIARRITMTGFLVMDYAARFDEARRDLSAWLADGRLRAREDVQEGFENIPTTFLRLFTGQNIGKQVLKVADPARVD
ncbi:MAG: NADP-dependent oxidoreductase [Acidobacteria bacterium]|nr:NADP-dependent oxidoreductase [Acidobacteriota bacterium]MDP7692511.1 NADP-dependent oxidoreductase [Vicinamibacterales bacterium]HJN46187.1 NADP-dependent oxidoreductase [Vicinamibacterales bacterium]